MISLRSLLLEVFNTTPKAIILSGAAGIGKSSLMNTIQPHIPADFKVFNPDTFNPEDDPKRPNIVKNSKTIRTKAIPNAINNKQNFVYADFIPKVLRDRYFQNEEVHKHA